MSFFSSLGRIFTFGKKAADPYPGTWTPVAGEPGGVNEANLLLNNKEWVFIAVDVIASAVASVRFKVMRYRSNGDDQEVFDGPLVDFLEAPAPSFTGKDFVYLNTAYKELTGNALWELKGGAKLNPLIPTKIVPIVEKGELLGFKYQDGPTLRTIPISRVLHDRYVDLARPYWGVGKLQKIARWVDTGSFATEFLKRFFINGASFGGFIETEEESQERIKLIKAGLQNDHVGVENAHKIGVLPKGSKYAKVTANMSEIEMGATDDRYRDKILAGFRVPKTIVGLTTEVNRASAEASEYIFAKYTIKPIADDLIEFLNANVVPLFDRSGSYYFAYDEFVPTNQEIELKARESSLSKQPYKTVNEVRAEVGLPPVANGDVIYGNPMLLPLGTPAPSPEPANDDRPAPKKAVPRTVRRAASLDRMLDSIARGIAPLTFDPDLVAHKHFVGRVEAHQKLLGDKVRDFNNRQERDVQQNLRHIVKAVSKGDLFDLNAEMAILADFVGPLLKGLLTEQAIAEYEAQGFEGSFDSTSQRLARVVDLAARRLARSYNSTTAKLLKSALNDGIDAGDDLTQLAARVRSIYEFSNVVRAKMVAQTEAFYIANEGSREAYRQAGVVKTLRWWTAEDERVCEFCGPQHGREIGITETFFPKGHELEGSDGGHMTLNYRAIDVPPLHTNCRCFIRPGAIDTA